VRISISEMLRGSAFRRKSMKKTAVSRATPLAAVFFPRGVGMSRSLAVFSTRPHLTDRSIVSRMT